MFNPTSSTILDIQLKGQIVLTGRKLDTTEIYLSQPIMKKYRNNRLTKGRRSCIIFFKFKKQDDQSNCRNRMESYGRYELGKKNDRRGI